MEKGTQMLKERRNVGMRIAGSTWIVVDMPEYRLLFQCAEPRREGSNRWLKVVVGASPSSFTKQYYVADDQKHDDVEV